MGYTSARSAGVQAITRPRYYAFQPSELAFERGAIGVCSHVETHERGGEARRRYAHRDELGADQKVRHADVAVIGNDPSRQGASRRRVVARHLLPVVDVAEAVILAVIPRERTRVVNIILRPMNEMT